MSSKEGNMKSKFCWKAKRVRQEGGCVDFWELFQRLENGVTLILAEIGPLPDDYKKERNDGKNYQSQFICKVEKKLNLEPTETVEESISRFNKYFGIYQ